MFVVLLALFFNPLSFATPDTFTPVPAHDMSAQCPNPPLDISTQNNVQKNTGFEELFSLTLGTPSENFAHKLILALTGAPMSSASPTFQRVATMIEQNKLLDAAALITREKNFLQIRLRNFAAPLSSKTFSPLEPFNDLQSLIIGITRDELDARLILTGNLRYSGEGLGLPVVSRANNEHYLQFDNNGYDLTRDLKRVNSQWSDLAIGTGAFSTRTWAKNTYEAGTNRRAVKLAFETFLCAPIESWKTRGLPDDFVRRDVDRAPAGDPATFLNHCRGCHAPMDAIGGAFARFNFVDNQIVYDANKVMEKMNQHQDVYPAGYVTIDDSWTNLLANSALVDFGWRSEAKGTGIQSFAQTLADSVAFSRCMASRVLKEICGKD